MMSLAAMLIALVAAIDVQAEVPSEPRPLERVVVIGASASSGWAVVVARTEEARNAPPEETILGVTHRHVDFAEVLDQVLVGAGQPIESAASLGFFTAPLRIGRSQIDAALKAKPTTVVAIDFLFWYGYGHLARRQEDETTRRLAHLERGLAQLDRLDTRVLVGDLPDVSEAAHVRPISLLSPEQVPSPEALDAMNLRIEEWVLANHDATLIPLSAAVHRMGHGEGLTINGHEWSAESVLLQFDQLHPTLDGLIALGEIVAESMVEHVPGVTSSDVQADPAKVLAALANSGSTDPAAP